MKNLTKTQKVFAGIGIALLTLVLLACGVVDVWYLYLEQYGQHKLVTNVFNFGELEAETGDKAYIWEFNYHSNANKNGLECLEIKSTYFKDKNQTSMYSQGLQYVANSPEENIEWFTYDDLKIEIDKVSGIQGLPIVDAWNDEIDQDFGVTSYKVHSSGWWIFATNYYANYFAPFVKEGATRYNYQSNDDFVSFGSTNPLSSNSFLTIETGDDSSTEEDESEVFNMRFKADNYAEFINVESFTEDREKIGQYGTENYYYNYNEDYFAWRVYESVKALPAGTSGTYVFEFGDCFKYYYGDSDKEIKDEDTTLVERQIKNYYTIKVNVSADGVRNANDSMFGAVHGSANYVVNGDTTDAGNYFAGKTIVECDVYDFDLVKVTDNKVALKLKNSFIQEHKQYANDIALRIIIDYSILAEENVEYIGFTADSGLDNFEIYEIQTINAEVA